MLWKLMEVPDIWRHPAVLLFPALHVLLLRFSNTTRLIFILNMVLFLQRFKKLFRAHVWVFSHSYFLSFSASMFYSSCLTGCRVFTVALTKWWNLNLKRKWKLLMSVYYTVQLCKGDILFSGPFWIGKKRCPLMLKSNVCITLSPSIDGWEMCRPINKVEQSSTSLKLTALYLFCLRSFS